MSVFILATFPPAHADEKKADSGRPAWVDGNMGEKYSEQRYLTAVGAGKTRGAADQDAKKSLAGNLRAKVTSESTSESESSLSENTSARVEGKGTSKMKTNVQISTSLVLRGVEIKQHYFDPQTKEFYALAVMDKMKAKNSYNMELSSLKKKIEVLYERFQSNPDLGTATDILNLSDQFEALNQEYSVVNDGHGAMPALTYTQLEKVRDQISSLQSTQAIALEFSGDTQRPEFQEMITSCLSEKSIAVIGKLEEGKGPDYHVIYNISEKQKFMDVKGWVKYEFSSLAVVKKKNILVARKRVSRDATGRDKENAFDSVKEDLSEALCSQIAKIVIR